MGNYYEGSLKFFFKELPIDMCNLIKMRENYEDIEEIRKKYPDIKWLQHECAYSLSFSLEELTSEASQEEGIKYYLNIYIRHKGLRLGFDLAEAIVDYFKPYNYVGKYNTHGYIGKIEDEDGTYCKEFWSDYTWLESEQKSREYLCNDCPYSSQWKGSLCKRYEVCKRAYDLARNSEEKSEWIEHKWAEEDNGLLISNYECSKCHNWKREKTEYCPECGVKMKI